MKNKTTEKIEWIVDRHHHWCRVAEQKLDAVQDMIGKRPACHIQIKGGNIAGRYYKKRKQCLYVLPFAFLEEDYDSTIAHEVAHHYQYLLWPSAQSHGEMFYFVQNVILGQRERRCHSYDVNKARALGKLLAASRIQWFNYEEWTIIKDTRQDMILEI